MAQVFIYSIIYLILILFFWSLCAIGQDSFHKYSDGLKIIEVANGAASTVPANTKNRAYTIQSLYFQDLNVPEVPSINYTFRNPLPVPRRNWGIQPSTGILLFIHHLPSQINHIQR